MRKHFLVVMSALLCICARTSPADESARAQMKGLDEQVQEVKTTVLVHREAELKNPASEESLVPSDTSPAGSPKSWHKALEADVDACRFRRRTAGSHYVYSFKELDALHKGGGAAGLSGNIVTGAHEIEVR
jgi:hypothetical protein